MRVLMLMHPDLVPPDGPVSPEESEPFKTELHVFQALSAEHEVHKIGVRDELTPIWTAKEQLRPDIAFNLLEEFDGQAVFDQNVVSYLELIGLPYTGCNPRGLVLARDKALAKKVLTYHRISVPDFFVAPRAQKVKRPRRLRFPLIVKSLVEEASLGIAQASIVDNDERLTERVGFIHDRLGTDALVEEFIEGRELYVGVFGNHRLAVLPVWELRFDKLPEDQHMIATRKAKWDRAYQKKHQIDSGPAQGLEPAIVDRIHRVAKRIYRALSLSGYARLDFRLKPTGELYFIEANPNPQIAEDEDFAQSAKAAGIAYDKLLGRILALGLKDR